MEPATPVAFLLALKHDQALLGRGDISTAMPHLLLEIYHSTYGHNSGHYSDPTFDVMHATADSTEAKRPCVEMNKFIIENPRGIRIFTKDIYNVWQPWLKGCGGG